MEYNRFNFHKSTFCIFREAQAPERPCDFRSKSGSEYWFSEDGVFRKSNHWGRAAKCKWRLVSGASLSRTKSGFAKWDEFYSDNELEKLYFIEVVNGKADYFHKNSIGKDSVFLRTSGETVKRLRQIRTYLADIGISNGEQDETLKLLISTDHPMWRIRSMVSESSNS